jgi:hypothetical protein
MIRMILEVVRSLTEKAKERKMRQQPDENSSAAWEASSRRQEAGAIRGVGAHLQAALQWQISLGTCVVVTTAMMTLIGMEVLFGAGVLVGALLAPDLIMHSSQAAPMHP